MLNKAFFGSFELGRVLNDLKLTCLDIGASKGFCEDLLPIAPSINAIGFEPNPEECKHLNLTVTQEDIPWNSLKYIPTAIGKEKGLRTLHIYKHHGCSSMLEADIALASNFSRSDYFQLDKTIDVTVSPLDEAAESYGFFDVVFMKIDVEGAEMEVLESGPKLLNNHVQVVRIEVSFIPRFQRQPLFCDIDHYLRKFGFMPMRFLELHHWRRTTKRKLPYLSKGRIPYSQGQMAHGDILYFRNPDLIFFDKPESINESLKAAFLALNYEYVDHARTILLKPIIEQYLRSKYCFDVNEALSDVSLYLVSQYYRNEIRQIMGATKRLLRQKISFF